MPQWREPSRTRRAAAWWLLSRALPWQPEPAAPGLNELAAPILCNSAKSDPNPEVRQVATWALGAIGFYSQEALQIMLGALNHSDPADRKAACRWFGRNKLAAEKVVPILLRGLQDNVMRSDYAEALRAYGPQAKFLVEPLVALAKTNDSAIASVASWALSGVDPIAARKAGVNP
jgi:HEAT repeat protein